MHITTAYHTDIGTTKPVNQDSLSIQVAKTSQLWGLSGVSSTSPATIVMAVMCDGMGGLSEGEMASASVVEAFSDWFLKRLPRYLLPPVSQGEAGRTGSTDAETMQQRQMEALGTEFDRLLRKQNRLLANYGEKHRLQTGTTATALLLMDRYGLLIGHVGDSRVYELLMPSAEECVLARQLTQDHTLIGHKLKRGRISSKEARRDPSRHILLQCVGVSHTVHPEIITATPAQEAIYLLTSDGFHNHLTPQELSKQFSPRRLLQEDALKQSAVNLVKRVKKRRERDNISVIAIQVSQ